MKKHLLLIIVAIVATLTQLSAKEYEWVHLGDISKSLNERNVIFLQGSDISNAVSDLESLPRNARVMNPTRSGVKFKDVTIAQPGTLASVLGDEINDIDSLVVRGEINAADLYTMWRSSFYGGLTVLNLEYAEIQGNKLPKNAFWYQSEQYTLGAEYIDCIPLRRIILPEGLEEIGESAFAYAISLEDVNFPSALRSIKRSCFSDCIRLNVNPLIIPEGVEEIGSMAFVDCKALTGRVVLPTTLKRINVGAFFQSKITECNFPEGLTKIGEGAFYACRLKTVDIPESCQDLEGSIFQLNLELESIHLPEGIERIPGAFLNACIKLQSINIPSTVKHIEHYGLWQCRSLKNLELPEGLETIGEVGLWYLDSLQRIVFPSTLKTIGAESCYYWAGIKEIYCAATEPPVCHDSALNPGTTPFGSYGSTFYMRTPQDTPIYVPVGSADLYRNAWGWNYFTNFIEIDFSGIDSPYYDATDSSGLIYDLQGRRVLDPIQGQIYIDIKTGRKFIYR